eukprot:1335347-Lingulodinium_polyedra.AAC.1
MRLAHHTLDDGQARVLSHALEEAQVLLHGAALVNEDHERNHAVAKAAAPLTHGAIVIAGEAGRRHPDAAWRSSILELAQLIVLVAPALLPRKVRGHADALEPGRELAANVLPELVAFGR